MARCRVPDFRFRIFAINRITELRVMRKCGLAVRAIMILFKNKIRTVLVNLIDLDRADLQSVLQKNYFRVSLKVDGCQEWKTE